MVIESENLFYRSWSEFDAEDLYNLANSPLVGPSAGWNIHKNIKHSLEFITKFWSNPFDFAIIKNDTNTLIGGISIMPGFKSLLSLPEDEAEIGYWIGVAYWNKGYATEALKTMIDVSFNRLNFNKIWCGYWENNEASKRVQEKCGMKYQYTITDMPCYVDGYPDTVTEYLTAVSRFDDRV